MKTLSRSDLEVLLGAALYPLKPHLDAEIAQVGQELSSLTCSQPTPTQEELVAMLKAADAALYDSAARLADAFLQAIRDRGFHSLGDIASDDQDWFELHALLHLEDLVQKVEEEALPGALQAHKARTCLFLLELGLGLGEVGGTPIDSFLSKQAPVRDYFRAGLRAENIAKWAKLPECPPLLDALELKPTFFGVGINLNFILKKLWRRFRHG